MCCNGGSLKIDLNEMAARRSDHEAYIPTLYCPPETLNKIPGSIMRSILKTEVTVYIDM